MSDDRDVGRRIVLQGAGAAAAASLFARTMADAVDATDAENRAPPGTEELAVRTAALAYDDLPEAAIEEAKTQTKSILGVAYAAVDDLESFDNVRRFATEL